MPAPDQRWAVLAFRWSPAAELGILRGHRLVAGEPWRKQLQGRWRERKVRQHCLADFGTRRPA